MAHPVVVTIANAFRDEGWNVLRFNFRGAGKSTGSYGHGIDEVQDVKAAARWLRRKGVDQLVIGGYSFGASVTLRAILSNEVDAEGWLGVSLPSQQYFDSIWKVDGNLQIPSRFIGGETDYMYDVNAIEERWVTTPQVGSAVIPDADHFFSQKHNREDLTAQVHDYIAESFNVPA
jgi:alpha/beta superfamily hydrolase